MEIKHRKFLSSSTHTVHASTICFFKDKLIKAYFGGSREGMPDCAIYIHFDDKVVSIGGKDAMPRWNPILFPYEDKLFLFIKVGIYVDRWANLVYDLSNIFDNDFDINKISPQISAAGLNGPVKCKPIVYNNMVYCGSSVENILSWDSCIESYKVKGSEFMIWDRSLPLTVPKQIYVDEYGRKGRSLGIIQPSLYLDKNNKLNAFFRSSRGLGKIYYSQNLSKENNSWTRPTATKFDNPNSGIDCVYVEGRLFLVYNPSSTYRYPLVLSELDEEFNEKERLVIREGIDESDVTYSAELSYPFLIENNGKLYLTYSYGRSRIEVLTISID